MTGHFRPHERTRVCMTERTVIETVTDVKNKSMKFDDFEDPEQPVGLFPECVSTSPVMGFA